MGTLNEEIGLYINGNLMGTQIKPLTGTENGAVILNSINGNF